MTILYVGRPGVPGALAALIAQGRIHRRQRILDVGCGTGTDVLLLASWGFRRVEGLDPDPGAIATARSRAKRRGLDVRFHVADARHLPELFGPRRFDVLLHTLVANNLREGFDEHFRALASVLRKDGLLVLHERVTKPYENAGPGQVAPMPALRKHFDLGPGVGTHLSERAPAGMRPAHARVMLWVGRPRTQAG